MKNIKSFSIKKLFYNKRFALTFSLIFAFVFWLIIAIEQNPERERTFNKIPVTINTQGSAMESLGIDIINDISDKNVSVTVFGPNYIVSSLKSEDIIVTASVADVINPGTYELKLSAHQNGNEDGYSFVSVSPSTIRVTCDYVDTKEFTVSAKADGVSASVSSNLIKEEPLISDAENSTITIKGPRTVIQKISSVVAVAYDKATLEATKKFDAEIELFDDDGNKIDKSNLSLSVEKASIIVPISKKAVLKVVPVFKNLPNQTIKDVLKYDLSVAEVTVIGPPATIESMKEVSLETIDLREVSTSNNNFTKKLVLPDGVKLQDNIDSVSVKVKTQEFDEKTVNVSNIKFDNLSSGLTVSNYSTIKNVKVCGKSQEIKKLYASDLIAVADLSEKKAGEYIIEVKIKSDKYPDIWQIGSYTVSVTIK